MEQEYLCAACNFRTTNKYNWAIHTETIKHKAKKEGLKCNECGSVFNRLNLLTRHIKNTHIKKEKRIKEYLIATDPNRIKLDIKKKLNIKKKTDSTTGDTTVIAPIKQKIQILPIRKKIIIQKKI